MFADLGLRAVSIDGRMSNRVILQALAAIDAGQGLKAFFNARCHDAGLTGRRFIVYDTRTSNGMIVDRRGNSRARLHFHGIFEMPEKMTYKELRAILRKVFGNAASMTRYQLHIQPIIGPQEQPMLHHEVNGVCGYGPMGKVFYALDHAGTSYATLGLNGDGKRSRSAPWQGAANRAGKRLAKGEPSNFNREVVFFDRLSGQLGREVFEAWIDREKVLQARRTGTAPRKRRSVKGMPGVERKAG